MPAHHPTELPPELRSILEDALRSGALDAAVQARATDLGWTPAAERLFTGPAALTRVPPLWGPR
jgi:hypothetical protein